MSLAGMTQEETNQYNYRSCRSIADKLNLCAEGRLRHCPQCGDANEPEELDDISQIPDFVEGEDDPEDFDIGDYRKCPFCGHVFTTEEFEEYDFYSFPDDVYNTEYRINSYGEYNSVELMVACGGPNIYIDTDDNSVRLHWGGDFAKAYFSSDAGDQLDEIWEERCSEVVGIRRR